MSSLVTVELFAEDRAHEALLRPLIRRVCDEEGKPAEVRVRSARGGHGRAISEFEAYQRVLLRKGMGLPGAIVVAIDANCAAFAAAREQVTGALHRDLTDICVPACPDPHIEQWYLADLEAFRRVVGITPTAPAGK